MLMFLGLKITFGSAKVSMFLDVLILSVLIAINVSALSTVSFSSYCLVRPSLNVIGLLAKALFTVGITVSTVACLIGWILDDIIGSITDVSDWTKLS